MIDRILYLKYPFFWLSLTYNWTLQRFSQYYDLASHTTYVVCLNCIREYKSLKSILKNTFLRSFSWQFYFTITAFAKSLLCWQYVRQHTTYLSYLSLTKATSVKQPFVQDSITRGFADITPKIMNSLNSFFVSLKFQTSNSVSYRWK